MDRPKGISILLFAGNRYCPDTLAPAHTRGVASPLSNAPVNYNRTNLPLGIIVGQLYTSFGCETKITFCNITHKASGQFFCHRMIRWSPHPFQKTLFDLFHRTNKTGADSRYWDFRFLYDPRTSGYLAPVFFAASLPL
jgi:hypothetical protein